VVTIRHWQLVWAHYVLRWQTSVEADRDRGEISTTTIVLTFILVGLALSVGAIIVSKVTDKANSIDLDK
jgi:hypothetical protein